MRQRNHKSESTESPTNEGTVSRMNKTAVQEAVYIWKLSCVQNTWLREGSYMSSPSWEQAYDPTSGNLSASVSQQNGWKIKRWACILFVGGRGNKSKT